MKYNIGFSSNFTQDQLDMYYSNMYEKIFIHDLLCTMINFHFFQIEVKSSLLYLSILVHKYNISLYFLSQLSN